MGLLDIYNAAISANQLNTLDPDLVTQYPETVTGTPTTTQNPGGMPQNFDQIYNSDNTYLSTLNTPNPGVLKDTLNITNLDTSDPGVQGGIPYRQLSDPTSYPPTVNHTSPIKGWFAEPSEPPTKFNQVYNSNNTYLDFIDSYT